MRKFKKRVIFAAIIAVALILSVTLAACTTKTTSSQWVAEIISEYYYTDVEITDADALSPDEIVAKYLDRYSEFQRHRHDVRPGLTGYSQVNGRNAVSWEEKFEMDVWYVDHVSFMTDLRIAIKTFTTVMKRDGISSGTSETMEEFMGTEEKRETSEEGK